MLLVSSLALLVNALLSQVNNQVYLYFDVLLDCYHEVRVKPRVVLVALSNGEGPEANRSLVQAQFPIKCSPPTLASTREDMVVKVRPKPSVF